jgi:hypothetical protein
LRLLHPLGDIGFAEKFKYPKRAVRSSDENSFLSGIWERWSAFMGIAIEPDQS